MTRLCASAVFYGGPENMSMIRSLRWDGFDIFNNFARLLLKDYFRWSYPLPLGFS